MAEQPYRSPAQLPDAHQREVLLVLSEELIEIIEECILVGMRVSKLQRFGADEVQPLQRITGGATNAERLGHEIGDLLEIIDRACESGVIKQADIAEGRVRKRAQLARFMQTQPLDPPEAGEEWFRKAKLVEPKDG